MALTFTPSRPNQRLAAGDTQALILERFNKQVEMIIKKTCVTKGQMQNFDFVSGTGTFTKKGLGDTSLQLLVPGTAPDGSLLEANKISVTIEELLIQRNFVPLIDKFQTDFDVQSRIAERQAQKFAEFIDKTVLITALKAAKETTSKYGIAGYKGGTQVTIPTADANDPSVLMDAIRRLFNGVEKKDVNPREEGMELYVTPDVYWNLAGSDLLINGEFKTADGNVLNGNRMVLKTYGIPVVSTNNSPLGQNITSHLLNTTKNGNFYNVDATDDLMILCSPKAIWGAKHGDVTSEMFEDKLTRCDVIDSWYGFATTIDRAEYAGVVSMV